MVLGDVPYRDELMELMIYQPPIGKYPGIGFSRFIGKPVHVVWQVPVWDLLGYVTVTHKDGIRERVPTWQARYYGYVVEFDTQLPAEHFVRQPKLSAPKAKESA